MTDARPVPSSHVSPRRRALDGLSRVGQDSADSEEVRLQKSLLLISSVMLASLSVIWGSIYYVLDRPLAAAIPLSYAVASFLSIVTFGLTRRYRLFRFSQLLLTLLVPFFLMVALGGFVNSSAVIAWSLASPLGALVFSGRRPAIGWLLAFVVLMAVGVALGGSWYAGTPLAPAVITTFFFMNIAGMSVVAFVLMYRFVSEREKAYHELAEAHGVEQEAMRRMLQMQNQLVQQEKMASLGRLTAGIAHEIKNPLNFVNNFAALSTELAGELEAELADGRDLSALQPLLTDLKANATKIEDHGKRADAIVRGMMAHARGSGDEPKHVDLNALVEEHVGLAYHGKRAHTPGFTVELVQDYDPEVGEVEVIPQELGRVILNLCANAFDAVAEHAETRNGQAADESYAPMVRITTRRVSDAIEIVVADNGAGIPARLRGHIFEPFFTTKPTGSGTGLGLSLSHDIITQQHKGTLRAESEEGAGATFIIRLPA